MLFQSGVGVKVKAHAWLLRVRGALQHEADKYHAADNFYCIFPDCVGSKSLHT